MKSKMRSYILTDYKYLYDYKYMDTKKYTEANKVVNIATGGNLVWLISDKRQKWQKKLKPAY